jgi:hypothetical protein
LYAASHPRRNAVLREWGEGTALSRNQNGRRRYPFPCAAGAHSGRAYDGIFSHLSDDVCAARETMGLGIVLAVLVLLRQWRSSPGSVWARILKERRRSRRRLSPRGSPSCALLQSVVARAIACRQAAESTLIRNSPFTIQNCLLVMFDPLGTALLT